jgi:hypothetical protein
MVYQLALSAGVTDERILKKSAFPVLDTDLNTAAGRGEYDAAIKKTIGSLPALQRSRIEAQQPCHADHDSSHLK